MSYVYGDVLWEFVYFNNNYENRNELRWEFLEEFLGMKYVYILELIYINNYENHDVKLSRILLNLIEENNLNLQT